MSFNKITEMGDLSAHHALTKLVLDSILLYFNKHHFLSINHFIDDDGCILFVLTYAWSMNAVKLLLHVHWSSLSWLFMFLCFVCNLVMVTSDMSFVYSINKKKLMTSFIMLTIIYVKNMQITYSMSLYRFRTSICFGYIFIVHADVYNYVYL